MKKSSVIFRIEGEKDRSIRTAHICELKKLVTRRQQSMDQPTTITPKIPTRRPPKIRKLNTSNPGTSISGEIGKNT
jgi:hypothetical protein